MNDFLKTLKLEENLSTTIQSSKLDFESYLNKIVETGETDWYSGSTDAFSINKYIFKGHLYNDGFEIKERVNFRQSTLAKAIGKISEANEQTIIEIKIIGLSNFLILFYALILIQSAVFCYDFFSGNINLDTFERILILILYSFFLLFPAILTKWSIKALKNALQETILNYSTNT